MHALPLPNLKIGIFASASMDTKSMQKAAFSASYMVSVTADCTSAAAFSIMMAAALCRLLIK